jgi:hypothetical protein
VLREPQVTLVLRDSLETQVIQGHREPQDHWDLEEPEEQEYLVLLDLPDQLVLQVQREPLDLQALLVLLVLEVLLVLVEQLEKLVLLESQVQEEQPDSLVLVPSLSY